MLIDQIKSTTSKLNPLSSGTGQEEGAGKQVSTERSAAAQRSRSHSEEEDNDHGMYSVRLSSDDSDERPSPVKRNSRNGGIRRESSAAKPRTDEETANEGILEQIKSKTLNAGKVVVNTTASAGSAVVGGLKATTQLLNPMNIGKPKEAEEPPVDQAKIDEEFANIQIEDPPEEEKPKPQQMGFLSQLKAKTGLSGGGEQAPARRESAHIPPAPPHTSPKHMFHHEDRMRAERKAHEHGTGHEHTPPEPPKETFLDQIRAKTGFAKEKDDIAHDSAPKEGFMSQLKVPNPFASAPAEPAKKTPLPPPRRESSVRPNSTSSGSGITGMFDSLIGKNDPPKKEPPKQASLLDHITGNTPATKKEPSFFDSLTGNSTKSSDSGFW